MYIHMWHMGLYPYIYIYTYVYIYIHIPSLYMCLIFHLFIFGNPAKIYVCNPFSAFSTHVFFYIREPEGIASK